MRRVRADSPGDDEPPATRRALDGGGVPRRAPQPPPASAAGGAGAAAPAPADPEWDGAWADPLPAELAEPRPWVLFSDLHASHRTRDVILTVLDAVHDAAMARGAGIIFLGDFWDRRGSLLVSLLNDVLRRVRAWRVPTILIPGNHDQVSLGGEDSALVPLAAANPAFIHLVSRPLRFAGALWIPYRRHASVIRGVLRHPAVVSAPPAAVFAHVDVLGASMSRGVLATVGVAGRDFPQGVPVYTGHYHEPHAVAGAPNVVYVGSPYQVSASEEGHDKRLLVLDAAWRVKEELPLRVGPRHVTLDGPAAAAPVAHAIAQLRAGDRVRWRLPAPPGPDTRERVEALRCAGVHVAMEVQPPPGAGDGAARLVLAATPLDILRQYVGTLSAAQRPSAAALARAEAFVEEAAPRGGGGAGDDGGATWVELSRVELTGYGPFRQRVAYPLDSGGLVVLTGDNGGDASSDSNGSGKTSLAFAALWVLSGKLDSRSGSGPSLLKAHHIHDKADEAAGTLWGRVGSSSADARPFIVTRVVKRQSAGGTLTFRCGDVYVDAPAEAQAAINSRLQPDLLEAVAFHTDANVAYMLDANDSAFKARMDLVLRLGVWDVAHRAAKAASKVAQARSGTAAGAASSARAVNERSADKATSSNSMLATVRREFNDVAAELRQSIFPELERSVSELAAWEATARDAVAAAAAAVDEASTAALTVDESAIVAGDPRVLSARATLAGLTAKLDDLMTAASDAAAGHKDARRAAHATRDALERFRSVAALGDNDGGDRDDPVCDRCGQRIDPEHAEHSVQRLAQEANDAVAAESAAGSASAAAASRLSEHRLALALAVADETKAVAIVRAELREAAKVRAQRASEARGRSRARWGAIQTAATVALAEARVLRTHLTSTMGGADAAAAPAPAEPRVALDADVAERRLPQLRKAVAAANRAGAGLGVAQQQVMLAQRDADSAAATAADAAERFAEAVTEARAADYRCTL